MSQEKVLFTNEDWKLIEVSTISKDSKRQHFDQTEDMLFISAIKHKCNYASTRRSKEGDVIGTWKSNLKESVYLDEEDTVKGRCWWCMKTVPEDVNALWKLQNWDVIPKVHISDSWNEGQVKARIREITKIDKSRKKANVV